MSATYYFHAAAGGARRVSRVFSRAAYGQIARFFASPYAEQTDALREVQALLDPLLQAEETLCATAVFSGFKSRLGRDGRYVLQLDRKHSLNITYRDAQYCVTGLGEDSLFFASANEVAEALTPVLEEAIQKNKAGLMRRSTYYGYIPAGTAIAFGVGTAIAVHLGAFDDMLIRNEPAGDIPAASIQLDDTYHPR